ncbi:hypothetical protein HMPREF1062_06359, partial [Bacteroides cellulosilyticus CL02T12C19]
MALITYHYPLITFIPLSHYKS